MKSTIAVILSMLMCGVQSSAIAADVLNGWSGDATITKIESNFTQTKFRLSNITNGCGSVDWWFLPLDETVVSKTKHSLLIAAYAANKVVNLRCENSKVSDFYVSN